jgi:GWxTD domain-containing protein
MLQPLQRTVSVGFLLFSFLPIYQATAQPRKPPKQQSSPTAVLRLDGGVPLHKVWLDEEVRWIITDDERAAFQLLGDEQERENFVEGFWDRRDPTPDTIENEFKEEHYRRIACANELFGAYGIPGWRTDRGRIYIMYGPSDQKESRQPGAKDHTPKEESGNVDRFPVEIWRYRYLEGIGQDVELEFVDTCLCGDYRLTLDPARKAALLTPFEPLTSKEAAAPHQGLSHPPAVKFKELERSLMPQRVVIHPLPFEVYTDFVKVTHATTLMPLTIQFQNRDLAFAQKGGVDSSVLNLIGRITTLTGRVVVVFEDTFQVDISREDAAESMNRMSHYRNNLLLRPGRYQLSVAVKDINGERIGTWSRGIRVPGYEADTLSVSSLILADKVEVANVQPRVAPHEGTPSRFQRGEPINAWMQAYGLAVDQTSHQPSVRAIYDVANVGGKSVIHREEEMGKAIPLGDQVTLKQTFDSAGLQVGDYALRVSVIDEVSKQTASIAIDFRVE